jgi:hypothetical protein
MCLIKGGFVGEKNFERYQNARYNNKKHFPVSGYQVMGKFYKTIILQHIYSCPFISYYFHLFFFVRGFEIDTVRSHLIGQNMSTSRLKIRDNVIYIPVSVELFF